MTAPTISTLVSMPRTKYKMIRVPQDEYQRLVEARRELLRHGTARLDGLPGVQQEAQQVDNTNDFTWGLVLGLGAAALIYLLTRNDKKGGD